MVNFVNLLSQQKNVSIDSIYSNSVQFTDGIIVKINEQFFRVNLSADQNSYSLQEIGLINPTITILKSKDR